MLIHASHYYVVLAHFDGWETEVFVVEAENSIGACEQVDAEMQDFNHREESDREYWIDSVIPLTYLIGRKANV